ncbi:hypothetical protein V8G54_006491 [Vigna mungo]|uniref:Ubiquitin fusion degradation protein UFD1 N-terminal subdomain 1 domain-containing protein n=1 Tax=Vigna mungo TaxID=3915 RepID=A0AAQ3NZY3_VIGMU
MQLNCCDSLSLQPQRTNSGALCECIPLALRILLAVRELAIKHQEALRVDSRSSFIGKPQIEIGDKIIMPPSALDRLASLHIDYPMLFELRNDAAERVSHCGVDKIHPGVKLQIDDA